jgi:hypothetical protein
MARATPNEVRQLVVNAQSPGAAMALVRVAA